MKYNVSFTKRIIFTVIIFIIGVIFLSAGLSSYYKYSHALHPETLNREDLAIGKYIVGNIDTYIEGIRYENNIYHEVNQVHRTAWKTYDYYAMPIEEDSYITLLIADDSVKAQLEAYEDGHGEAIYFEGIIIEPSKQLTYELDETVEDFNPENFVDSFAIKETNLSYRNPIILGILLLVLSIFLFLISGGSNSFISVEKDETDYSIYENTLHKEDKL